MSQVIVTQDKYQEKRVRTKTQEDKITTEAQFKKWHRSDLSRPDPIAKLLGLAAIPLAFAWGLLFALMSVAIGVFMVVIKGLASIWKRSPPH